MKLSVWAVVCGRGRFKLYQRGYEVAPPYLMSGEEEDEHIAWGSESELYS